MEFTIRPILKRDAEDINIMRRMPGVFENILGTPAERLCASEDFIANLGSNDFQFVAVIKDSKGREKVIGNAGMSISPLPRTRHCGSFGIMVHADYQHMGVGKALMKSVLDMADNWLKLVRVELEVFTDNEKAIRLYEQFGFVIEGTLKMAAIRGGEYVDEYVMARINRAQNV